jgi:hypothetical protein
MDSSIRRISNAWVSRRRRCVCDMRHKIFTRLKLNHLSLSLCSYFTRSALRATIIEGKGDCSEKRLAEYNNIMRSLWGELSDLADFDKVSIFALQYSHFLPPHHLSRQHMHVGPKSLSLWFWQSKFEISLPF